MMETELVYSLGVDIGMVKEPVLLGFPVARKGAENELGLGKLAAVTGSPEPAIPKTGPFSIPRKLSI